MKSWRTSQASDFYVPTFYAISQVVRMHGPIYARKTGRVAVTSHIGARENISRNQIRLPRGGWGSEEHGSPEQGAKGQELSAEQPSTEYRVGAKGKAEAQGQ